jgi:sialic acid synthase SpsE
MDRIKITKTRSVGLNEPPYIIAEIGNNHNGRIDIAKKLIRISKEIGVDAVKFQVKDIETAFDKKLLDAPYTNENSFGLTYREHKQALEFSESELKEIYNFAEENKIDCFSTPFDTESVEILERLNNPIYKISSFHVTDLNLIKRVCETQKPIIVSTGMSSIDEIDKAIELIRKHTEQFILMQCTSCYPTEDNNVNLNVIPTLRKKYDCPVGYSGHERGIAICTSAVALGACAIERHFTVDRTMKGPDHAASVEPIGMSDIVSRSKKIFNAVGTTEKTVLDCELKNRKKFRGY